MKIYGNDGKEYKTVAEANKADAQLAKEQADKEAKIARLKEEREARAKAIKDAYINYNKLLKDFIKDYGSYHTTLTNNDINTDDLYKSFDGLVTSLFNKFWF